MGRTENQTSEMPPKLEEGTDTERVQIVAPSSWVDAVDEWRKARPGRVLNRSEAIRQLVEMSLAATAKKGGRGR
jgi:Arc/MetJ-type ribon-helix-helix transcriptional regulator